MRRNRLLVGTKKNSFVKGKDEHCSVAFDFQNDKKKSQNEKSPAQDVLRCIRRKKSESDLKSTEPKPQKPRVVFNSDSDTNVFKVIIQDNKFGSKELKGDKNNEEEESKGNDSSY